MFKTDDESVLPQYFKRKNKVHRRTQNTPMFVAILCLSLANSSTNLASKTAAHSTKNTFKTPIYKKSIKRRASVIKYLQEQPLNKHPCDKKWSNDEYISTQNISCSPSAPPLSLSEPPTMPPAMQVQLNLSFTYIVGLKGDGRSADHVKDEFNNTINSDLEHGTQQVVANSSQDIISDAWVENSGHTFMIFGDCVDDRETNLIRAKEISDSL